MFTDKYEAALQEKYSVPVVKYDDGSNIISGFELVKTVTPH